MSDVSFPTSLTCSDHPHGTDGYPIVKPPLDKTIRRGMTMIELLIAIAIVAALVAGLGVMAHAVYQGSEHSQSHALISQHARVAISRITTAANEAESSEAFPGVLVLQTTESGWTFPDRLAIWSPVASAVDPDGLPRVNEILFYVPNPDAANELLELRNTSDTSTVPTVDDQVAWHALIDSLLSANSSDSIVLTDLVHTAAVTSSTRVSEQRACLRFVMEMHPSAAEWADYKAGATDWSDLPFALDVRMGDSGLRHVWLRLELQLAPPDPVANSPTALAPVPYYGSSAFYYQLKK